ncbi:hypothetical protein F4780DRAFT_783299 [Xylariomycetidae sp. FL0641]|nr:hypothetical protein F4780DRAFT_783299 [Xylariomycetidae sp. FL0641]
MLHPTSFLHLSITILSFLAITALCDDDDDDGTKQKTAFKDPGTGWGGWAAPNGGVGGRGRGKTGGLVSSFRQAFNEDDNPPEVLGAFAASANDTALTYTFLCERCLNATLGLGAAQTKSTVEMGWGAGQRPRAQPRSVAAGFEDVAALAGEPLAPSADAQAIAPAAGSDDEDSDDEGAGGAAGAGAGTAAGVDSDGEESDADDD